MNFTLAAVVPSLVVLGLTSAASAVPLLQPRFTPLVRPAPVLVRGPVVPRGPLTPLDRVPTPVRIINTTPPAPAVAFGTPGTTLFHNGKPYIVPVTPVGPKITPAKDATRRLNAIRKNTAPGLFNKAPKVVTGPGYAPVTFNLTAPDNLGHAPTSVDITVNAGLDGLSPQAALARVRGKATMPIAPNNNRFVDGTILATHKAFTLSVNNAFTQGSPSNAFIRTNLAGAQVSILGVMSDDQPVVIMAKKPTDTRSHFYAADPGTGQYVEMPSMPYSVVMKAKLQDGLAAGVRVNYTTWGHSGLSGPLSTVQELGATVPDINHDSKPGQ